MATEPNRDPSAAEDAEQAEIREHLGRKARQNERMRAADKAEADASGAELERLRNALRIVAAHLTWNECALAVPQERPTKAEIANRLDYCISTARACLARADYAVRKIEP